MARNTKPRGLIRETWKDETCDRGCRWPYYRYRDAGLFVSPEDHWVEAYHGTWWYALRLILECNFLVESSSLDDGHDYWHPGVYCTSQLDTARHYGRAHHMFNDGVYHRLVLKVRIDRRKLKRERQKGGHQMVAIYCSLHCGRTFRR